MNKMCSNDPNLFSFSEVDPQLPPGAKLLPVAKVEGHFLASISGNER